MKRSLLLILAAALLLSGCSQSGSHLTSHAPHASSR